MSMFFNQKNATVYKLVDPLLPVITHYETLLPTIKHY